MLYVERSTGESRISKLKVRKDDGAQKMSGDIMIWRAISCTLKRLDREVCTLPPHHFVETLSRNFSLSSRTFVTSHETRHISHQ